MMKGKRRGFTVVELVIVIAVVAILAAVLIPTYVNLVKKSNEANALAEAKNLITEMLTDILLGKEGDADLLVFSEKGSDVYAYAYSRTEGKIIAYKNNPTAKTNSFEDTVKTILDAMIKENAITDRNVDKDDWRHPDNIKAVVNELNTKGTMIVYANYTINADEFAVHVHSFGAWESGDAENHIRRCSCGETEKAKHEWESKTENGVVTFTCKVCQATRTEVVSGDATHHLFRHIAKAATCTEEGNKEYWECVDKNCGKYFSDSGAKNEITDRNSVKIPATGNHTWDTGKVTKPATCKDAGVKTFTCTRCKTTKTETIAKTGHKWDDGKVTKEPTYVLEGAKEYTCTVCRETKVEVLDKKQAIISSEEEFKKAFEEAMNEEAKTLRVKLTSDLNLAKTNCLPPDEYFQNHLPFGSATLEMDLNGHTLYCENDSSSLFLYLVKDSKLVLKNGIVDGFPFEIEANAEVYLENITLKNAGFVLDLAGYEAGENGEIPESNPPAILKLNNCKAIYGEDKFDITKDNFKECCDLRSHLEFRARIFVNGEKAPVEGNTFEY